MKGLIARWIIGAAALYATVLLGQLFGLPMALKGVWQALLAVAVLAVINALIRPLVIILTLPLNCLTLGIATFAINALMFWLAGRIVPGFEVRSFWAAVFGSVVMGVINGIVSNIIGRNG